ncbi:ABC transporter ATP-binding protein [Mangrovactinospora gilvigrisea]|uniref:ABC transporter ATP-binding protein n=1 Tax=Mangrovactinospora gilvigrisea TaxID=1428644 RepID=A0A1J7C5Q6_9ACTN|nr:ABC transporter ATP-binding protein [Mangrovactinospora gilvigrisea]
MAAAGLEEPSDPGRWSVRVRGLHVTYRTPVDPRANTLRHRAMRMARASALRRGATAKDRGFREVLAVRGVDLDVEHGTVLGIIGANGAGKSTLMRAVAGILPPSQGRIEVNGRISTLLALGVGFNGNLSGRENVVLGGLAAGMTRRQIAERYEQIAAWADLGEFIDMPMKTYSSGMYGRLAFAVSTHMDPEVLLIDEALSAGDAKFKRKSYDKIGELVAQARTILLVSHAMGTLRELCSEVLWMHRGRAVALGDPEEVTAEYLRFQEVGEEPVVMEDV